MAEKRLRILVAKPGLDGHDRGAKIIARALRDGGFEVIYTGLHQTPEMIAEAAVQEDADAVGLSVLSGAHMTLFPEVMRLLKERGAGEVAVFGGGIIPDDDAVKLKELGVRQIFTPGASTEDIVKWVRENVAARYLTSNEFRSHRRAAANPRDARPTSPSAKSSRTRPGGTRNKASRGISSSSSASWAFWASHSLKNSAAAARTRSRKCSSSKGSRATTRRSD